MRDANSDEAPPWLSVVMPVHHGERWLAATLQSLAAQADGGIEVLLIDSSGDDRSLTIARRYRDRLRLSLDARPDLPGWPEKTNLAVARARAPHVAMLHQDDLWLPGRAAALRRWIAEAPDAALHLAPTLMIDGAGRVRGRWRCPLPPGAVPDAVLSSRLMVQNFVSVPAPVFRRDAYLAAGGLDPALWYTADWDLWIRLARAGAVRHHRRPTTAFRVHGGSLTMAGSARLEEFERQMRAVLARHAGWPRGSGPARLGELSIAVNVALAAAAAGERGRIGGALSALFAAGPVQLARYLHRSRIAERVSARLRCKLAGAF